MLANYADFICQRFGEYSNMKFHTRPDISPLTTPSPTFMGGFEGAVGDRNSGAGSMACLIN